MKKKLTDAIGLLADAGRLIDEAHRARELSGDEHRDATIAVSNARADVIRITGWKRAEPRPARPAKATEPFAHICCGCGGRIEIDGPVADGDRIECGACGTALIVVNPKRSEVDSVCS